MNELMEEQSRISHARQEQFIGTEADVLIESVDPLSGMYVGRSYMHAPDNVDGCVRFRSERDRQPGEFARVRFTKVAGLNLIGKEV